MIPAPRPAMDFEAILDSYPTPIVVLSPDFVIEAVNRARLEVTMTRREDTIGRPLFEIFPENPYEPSGGVALLQESLARVLADRRADRMPVVRYDIRDVSGRFVERWWSPLNVPVLGPEGSVRHIVHSVKDVTAEVHAKAEARLAREREAHIVETAQDYAIMTLDADRRVTSWSPGAAATFGYSEGEALGMLSDETFTPEDRAAGAPAAEAEQARRQGCAPNERWRLRKDGRRVFVRGSVRALHGADGALTGYLQIARDETRDRELRDALETREANFRALADSMPVLVAVADASGFVTFVNRRYQDFTGLPAADLLAEGWTKVVHAEDLARIGESWKAAVAAGRPFETELRLRARSGEHRWFLVRSTPFRDAAGAVRHWFSALSDIDERRRAEDRQALLTKEISHRVKNSLQLVSGFLTLQARRAPAAARPLIEEAASRVLTVAQVHDQLWRQSSVDVIRVAPFLTGLCESLSRAAPRFETRWSFEPASMATDAAAPIGLIVNEVLTNAFKYAYPGGRAGAVEVRGTRVDGRYRIEIRDWGVGLPEGFDLARPGESLGLRVINALAQQLKAEIHAENAGPGARITLLTPL